MKETFPWGRYVSDTDQSSRIDPRWGFFGKYKDDELKLSVDRRIVRPIKMVRDHQE